MTATAKVTSKGQLTLPKEVRRILAVREGSVVVFERENDRLVVRPARALREFGGVLRGKAADFDEMSCGEEARRVKGNRPWKGLRRSSLTPICLSAILPMTILTGQRPLTVF